jgi:hypothetical protein
MDKRVLESKRLVFLATKLFKENTEGREFLDLMKKFHVETPTFPIPETEMGKIERHGGAIAWAAFREGNLDMIRKIELMSNSAEYLNDQQEGK